MSHRGEIVDDPTDEDGDEIERPIELVPERIDPRGRRILHVWLRPRPR